MFMLIEDSGRKLWIKPDLVSAVELRHKDGKEVLAVFVEYNHFIIFQPKNVKTILKEIVG